MAENSTAGRNARGIDVRPTYLTRDVIRYPDGTPAFYLVEIEP